MKFLLSLFVSLILVCTTEVAAQELENIFTRSKVYIDTLSVKNISDISSSRFNSKFYDFTNEIKDQSFTNYSYWIKFNSPIRPNYYVTSKNIFIDKMVLFTPSTNGWQEKEVGLLAASNSGHSVLSIQIPEAALGKTCYLLVQSNCISKLDLWIIKGNALVENESFKTLFYAVLIALILLYFLVVVFLFFATKRKGILILALYAIASVLMILFTNGFLYQWLPSFNSLFYKWSFVYVVDIYWGSAALLSFYLFEVTKHSKRLTKAFYSAFALLIILMLTPFILDRQVVSQVHFAVPLIFIAFNTFVGFYLFLKKNVTSAIYLSVGWLIYFGLLIIWSISKTSHLPNSFFIDNAPVFGLIIEFILFAFIGARYYLSSQKQTDLMRNKLSSISAQKMKAEDSFGKDFSTLTKREKEVLALISDGNYDKEIAENLGISVASVRTYSKRIYTKLNVSNRTEASIIYNNLKIMESL